MNRQDTSKTPGTIKLNETFARLINGAASMDNIIAERRAARAAAQANEDAYARRHRLWVEITDPFTANFCQ